MFAMIGSGTRKLMCESCLDGWMSVCPVSSSRSRSRSGNHLDHLRTINQKFDFFTFLSLCVKVFSSFPFRFVEILQMIA